MILSLILASAALAEEPGLVEGIVFAADGSPVAGVEVRSGDVRAVSDSHGAWSLRLAAGEADLEIGAARVEHVPVVGSQTTEVLVTLVEGRANVSIEAPAAAPKRAAEAAGPPGELAGVVTDPASGAPLAGVKAFVRASDASAATDENGAFHLQLPAGNWDISFVRPGYATVTRTVEVRANEVVALPVTLEKTGLQLSDVTVTAPRIVGGTASILDERRDASTVSDILGAEQMSRSGDSDAASALKRVTGLTVIGGKYVYVRGLGDRYSATLLNGSSLPSPEPEKRVVPLDIFPTSLVDQVVIQKTFSPDRPAEFGGGVVEVKTRGIPEKPVFSLGLSGTYVAGPPSSAGSWVPRGNPTGPASAPRAARCPRRSPPRAKTRRSRPPDGSRRAATPRRRPRTSAS